MKFNKICCIFQALRVSMEEQRQRQEDEARRAQVKETTAAKQPETIKEAPNEEAMLKRALAMSLEGNEETATAAAASVETSAPPPSSASIPDFSHMTEDEQIAFAMQMSMQDQSWFYTHHLRLIIFILIDFVFMFTLQLQKNLKLKKMRPWTWRKITPLSCPIQHFYSLFWKTCLESIRSLRLFVRL